MNERAFLWIHEVLRIVLFEIITMLIMFILCISEFIYCFVLGLVIRLKMSQKLNLWITIIESLNLLGLTLNLYLILMFKINLLN